MKDLNEMEKVLDGILTEKELKEMDNRFEKIEEEGIKNTLKHFDRIHDKLFTFNNILIGGYFALAKIVASISIYTILIPLINLGILIYIEYRMMRKSKFEADINNKTKDCINNYGLRIQNTNLYSLLMIGSTSLVTLFFLYFLLKL